MNAILRVSSSGVFSVQSSRGTGVWPNSHRVSRARLRGGWRAEPILQGWEPAIQPLLSKEERPVNSTMVLLETMVLLDTYAQRAEPYQVRKSLFCSLLEQGRAPPVGHLHEYHEYKVGY